MLSCRREYKLSQHQTRPNYRHRKPGAAKSKQISLVKYFITQLLKFMGPAFVVSVAYIDPGNFATNISSGSVFGYQLLWVLFASNLMAVFLQINSAKLGIATGKNLSVICGEVFKKQVNWALWVISVIASVATTMAEFLGGALGFYLLLGIPLPIAGLLTGVVTFGIICMKKYGQKAVEIMITALIGVISAAYAIEMFLACPDLKEVAVHTLLPSLPNGQAVLLAAGMLGATVMPHVIFLHSELVQHRNGVKTVQGKRHHLKMEKIDVIIAMNIAFVVNAAMVIVSAAVFFKQGQSVDSIEQAHRSLEPLLGRLSSAAFGIALLASGFSSSAVGAMAGETMMDGFINLKMPVTLRRLITMVPAMAILLLGVNPMKALVFSQVSLSFALPFAIIPMLVITSRKDIMGPFVNSCLTRAAGWAITAVIISLNIVLLYLTFLGNAG